MSATGRNLAGAERQADDFYATPAWVTRAILPHIDLGSCPLDPAAGTGALLYELRLPDVEPWGIELDYVRAGVCALDRLSCVHRDALESDRPWIHPLTGAHPSAVVMNPPFKLALEFVERALKETSGEVVALLRLAFLESRERAAFHQQNPADVFVLAQRPSFVGYLKWKKQRCPLVIERPATANKKPKSERCELDAGHADFCRTLGTDSAAYGWFRWRRGGAETRLRPSNPGTIRVLDAGPKSEAAR